MEYELDDLVEDNFEKTVNVINSKKLMFKEIRNKILRQLRCRITQSKMRNLDLNFFPEWGIDVYESNVYNRRFETIPKIIKMIEKYFQYEELEQINRRLNSWTTKKILYQEIKIQDILCYRQTK
jgi:hypothetical protein